MKTILLGLAALFLLVGCEEGASRADLRVMPKIEGCSLERYEVQTKNGSSEVLYVARCKPTETASITTRYRCGRSCTKSVTTITTTEGTPEAGASEIPQ